MLYESQVRPRIEALIKEAEEERLLKIAEPSKSEVQRRLPYAMALAFRDRHRVDDPRTGGRHGFSSQLALEGFLESSVVTHAGQGLDTEPRN